MEFIKNNFLNTTTMMTVNSNTSTAANLFSSDQFSQYFSDGLNSDATTSSITITFDATTQVSRIALLDINAKKFSLYYNGSTANAFAMTTTASTTTSSWTTNSETSMYIRTTPVNITSFTIDMYSTQEANQEKVLGRLILSDPYYALTHIPSANNYQPVLKSKQVVHTLSDGGTRVHRVRNKWSTNFSLSYISQTIRDSLKTVYDLQTSFIFCPFGTTTSWDSIVFESVWVGDFDFYEYSDNASQSGYSGSVKLAETPT